MKVGNMKKYLVIGICLLIFITVFSLFLFNNADNRLITENREELKSITIQICDEKGNVEKSIIISDQVHMYSIYDHLNSTNTHINKDAPQIEGSIKILLTYSYAYDDQNGKQDIVFWGTDNNFYRYGDNNYVLGKNAELHSLLTDLFEKVELEMISEDQRQPKSITIREYEGNNVKSTIYLKDTEKIDYIFSNLETIQTKAILYPGEISELALDTEYEIILEYDDQENIIVFTGTETSDTFYKYSKTVSSSGGEGYIYGKNSELYKFIETLFENHKPIVSEGDI